MRTSKIRPIATALVLVGATVLFAGCGEDAYLPASLDGSSYSDVSNVTRPIDDPVLAGYDGVDSDTALDTDDPFSQAANDWNDVEGSMSTGLLDDPGYDDGFMPVGYGSGYGYGDGIFGTALTTAWGGAGGIMDVGLWGGDAGIMDAGFEDPGLLDDGGFDAGFDPGLDAAAMDPGFDAGFVDPGMDAGFVDPGFDAGAMDVGAVDVGPVDVGGFDAGMMDVGAVDVGGFDVGVGF